jgi:hypothetical protein
MTYMLDGQFMVLGGTDRKATLWTKDGVCSILTAFQLLEDVQCRSLHVQEHKLGNTTGVNDF